MRCHAQDTGAAESSYSVLEPPVCATPRQTGTLLMALSSVLGTENAVWARMLQTTKVLRHTSLLLLSIAACRNPAEPIPNEPKPWRERANAQVTPVASVTPGHAADAPLQNVAAGGKSLGPGPDLPYLGGSSGAGSSKARRVARR